MSLKFLEIQRAVNKFENVKSKILFFVLLSILVCINTDRKDQTGATPLKTALKDELFSGFDGRPISRASKKIVAFKMKKIFRNCDMARKARVVYLYTKKANRAS